MQFCPKCKTDLPLDAYKPSFRGKKGHWCRECCRPIKKASAARRADHIREYQQRYRKEHHEKLKADSRLRSKQHYQANKERYRVRSLAWHAANPEKVRESQRRYLYANWTERVEAFRRWRLANPEKARQQSKRYQARHADEIRERDNQKRVRRLSVHSEPIDYRALWAQSKGICYLCGEALDSSNVHFDHVIPLSRGGTHTMDNLKPTHPSCNQRKWSKLLAEL